MSRDTTVKLGSPTFIGLLLAQFTATFNDQASHIVAVFFAGDMLIDYVRSNVFDEKATPAIVALCFMLPFVLFSPLAGRVADRFSKRSTIVVWKLAEVGMMLLALAALSVPVLAGAPGPSPELATAAAILMISTVFLMGLHSTFFVPAKYGIMPEILDHSILSRGNGFLEGTSFMAQIFGTSVGGIVYVLCKSRISGPQSLEPGREWIVGLLLVGLASLGTATAVLMKPVPPADPGRSIAWTWWGPLRENLKILISARPLLLAVIGVSFVAFMTVFLRQTLLYDAELREKPNTVRAIVSGRAERPLEMKHPTWEDRLDAALEQPELKVSLMIALVGFGVGVGSLAAGYFSGHRVELGLVPLGAVAMVGHTLPMAAFLDSPLAMVIILFFLGLSGGFVVVPLYTQMQHRAPREKKGNIIAAATFVFVCGGIGAVVLFYLAAFGLEQLFGPALTLEAVKTNPALLPQYLAELKSQVRVSQALMLLTAGFTMLMTAILWVRQQDFPLRTAIWFRRLVTRPVGDHALVRLPPQGPIVLRLDCRTFLEAAFLAGSVDRYARMVIVERQRGFDNRLIRRLAAMCGWTILTETATEAEWERAAQWGLSSLARDELAGVAFVAVPGLSPARDRADQLLARWQTASGAQLAEASTLGP